MAKLGKALILIPGKLYPVRYGYQLRALQWKKFLEEYFTVNIVPVTRHLPTFRFPFDISFQESLFLDRSLLEILRLSKPELLIVLTSRLSFITNVDCKVIFDCIDPLFLNFYQRSIYYPLFAPLLILEARKVFVREKSGIKNALLATFVSPRDVEIFRSEGLNNVEWIPIFFVPKIYKKRKGSVFIFTGNLNYFVNYYSLIWWFENIYSVLPNKYKKKFVLVGKRPSYKKRRRIERYLAKSSIYYSPDDLTPFFEKSVFVVAPRITGTGIPVKVLDAWQYYLPVVGNSLVSEMLGVKEAILECKDVHDWVENIESLFESSYREKIVTTLLSEAFQYFSFSRVKELVLQKLLLYDILR